MSDMLQRQRRQKLMREMEGRESVDDVSYWQNRDDFNVFESRAGADQHTSFEENKLQALNDMIRKQQLVPA